jgi:hypothetical protein
MRKLLVLAGVAGAGVAAYRLVARPWLDTWGIEGDEPVRSLPGDEVIPDGQTLDTRGITIDAPPEAVWPWLLQMGYGRGGWYSYDAIDMRGESADQILAEHQSLAVGDIVPTDPAGGFEVRVIDPERALVLYVDTELRQRQEEAAGAAEAAPANVQAAGAFLAAANPPQFALTWAFVLEPLPGGRTRLLERTRGAFGESQPLAAITFPMLELGVFVMVRRQLLGIRERVEAAVRAQAAAPQAPDAEAADSAPSA